MLPLMDCKVLCLPAAIYAIYKAHDHERLFSPYIVHAYNIFACFLIKVYVFNYNSCTFNKINLICNKCLCVKSHFLMINIEK